MESLSLTSSSDLPLILFFPAFHPIRLASIPRLVPGREGPTLRQALTVSAEQFALTEASYVTVRLMQRFDQMVNREPETVVRHNLTLTSCSGNGVKVQLHEAAE